MSTDAKKVLKQFKRWLRVREMNFSAQAKASAENGWYSVAADEKWYANEARLMLIKIRSLEAGE